MRTDNSLQGAAQRICDVLNPILTPHGFAPGQTGFSPGSFQVLFCVAYDDFVERFPELDDSDQPTAIGTCIDLHVNGTAATGVTDSDLEGTPLADVLRSVGLTAAAERTSHLSDLMPDDALASVAAAFSELLPTPQP